MYKFYSVPKNSSDTPKILYADVILPLAVPCMTFAVPDNIREQIAVGQRVIVPIGNRKLYTGIIDRLRTEAPSYSRIKAIVRPIGTNPIVTPEQLDLWHWLSSYYMAPLGMVMRTALPAEFKSSGLSEEETSRNDFTPRSEPALKLHPEIDSEDRLHEVLDTLHRAKAQHRTLIEYLHRANIHSYTDSPAIPRRLFDISATALKSLTDKHILLQTEITCPYVEPRRPDIALPELSPAQLRALNSIRNGFTNKNVVLLHGVTGSGKTEIYIHLIAETLDAGHNVLFLLPEIALTDQLVNRMKRYFGETVRVYHSRQTPRQRAEVYDELLHTSGGKLLIGVRSAVLLPPNHLSLIIVDEEHDSSFKQTDSSPKYHGRDTAIYLASLCKAHTLLGSATPCAETYYNAAIGKYGHVVLNERYSGVTLPQVIVSNTLTAAKRGEKFSHFNKILLDRIAETLHRGRQVMLFQNRRGFSPFVTCGTCGWTAMCPDCNVSLTYHKNDSTLRCHYCGFHIPIPEHCPSCSTGSLIPQGFGTEKIEEELHHYFPDARIERLDADSARSTRNYQRIINSFSSGTTDILIGTQIITKGFDFGGVALVGILNADNLLLYPDFRSSERAFQLIVQVGGRAGRRDEQGTVIIQTTQPDHPVIRQAMNGDYEVMIHTLLTERQTFLYPPFCRVISIIFRHRDRTLLQRAADTFAAQARPRFGRMLMGPETPPVDRIRNQFRLQFLLKVDRHQAAVKQELTTLINELHNHPSFRSIEIIPDVDPQ